MSDAAAALSGHPLYPLFFPSSVAVVGASRDPRKRGYQVVRELTESAFTGRVFPVNPHGGEILGLPVFASVESLPETPDLALVCTPAATAPQVVAACGARGIRAAIILAVGFGESGAGGAKLEAELLAAARAGGIRVVGPNTSGIMNLPFALNLIGTRGVRAGHISVLVQSGNIALSLMTQVTERSREGIAICVGVGNALDVGFDECLDFLGRHEGTRAVVAYVEGLRSPRAFLAVAAEVTRTKPVILLKGARSEAGRGAARSHTGAIVGSYERLRAGLRQAGVVEVTRADELLHVAETLAWQPAGAAGAGVAVLTDGGGQGTLAVDGLTEAGVPLAQLSPETKNALGTLLGAAAATMNPVDLAGAADGDPGMFARALSILGDDAAVGAVLVVGLFGGYAIRFSEALGDAEEAAAEAMSSRMRALGKGLVVHSIYATHPSTPLDVLRESRVPVVESLEVACRCLVELWRRGALLSGPVWRPEAEAATREPRAEGAEMHQASARIRQARAEGRDALTELEAQSVLGAEGVPFPPAIHCRSADEVRRAIEEWAAPVAVKVHSEKIAHKSDGGGVVLDVEGADAGADAFERIRAQTAPALSGDHSASGFDGVIVTPMQPAPLMELIVGAYRDPELGPVLTVGAGGLWVDVWADVAHRVLPVEDEEIRAMLSELRSSPLLHGARGRERADLEAVVRAATAVARTMLDHGQIHEVEVNPLFVYPDRVVAVDAKVFLARS